MLGELAWCFHNEVMIAGTPYKVYRRIFELLVLPDCFLLLTTLNTLYNLTILGDQIATNILAIERSLSILINLLTLQVESFGETALAQVKLIDNLAPSNDNKSTGSSVSVKQVSVSGKPGGGVQLRIVPVGVAKQAGGTNVVKSNSVSQTPCSGTKIQTLKIGNTIIPTLNLGKKSQEQGGTTPSPLLKSSSNPVNPVVKAVLPSSIGPLTLEQLQSLLVKTIPALSQASTTPKSLSSLPTVTTAHSSIKATNSVIGSKIHATQPLVNNTFKAASTPVQNANRTTKPGSNVSYNGHLCLWV